jgi:DNA-binding response OmpR family regulator
VSPQQSGDLIVDLERLRVSLDGHPVSVDGLQLRLLLHFARHPDCVFSRTQLLVDVWGGRADSRDPKVVDVLVCRLRKRLGRASCLIQSVRGHGYRFMTTRRDPPPTEP